MEMKIPVEEYKNIRIKEIIFAKHLADSLACIYD
jgi:hypothetical protein